MDDPQADGTGLVPGRWINQDPDPANITDKGLNTIIPNYSANMSSIVFDSTANIKSDSTLTTGITLALPASFWWKSKLMPKIQVVAVKDGIQKVSNPLQLPTILLSTAGVLRSTLAANGNITYGVQVGVLGFTDVFHLSTVKNNLPSIIPIDPLYQLPLFYNTAVLTVNHNSALRSVSNEVIVAFQSAPPAPVPIVKAPQDQVKPRENGAPVTFTLTFEAPAAVQVYTHFTVTDLLHPALSLTSVSVKANGADIPFVSQYDPVTNLVTVDLDNNALTAGKTILITLDTEVEDVTKLPGNNVIENRSRLTLNHSSALFADSNTVTVRFPVEPERCQAITDLVASVAMEQAALAHILKAEGEKLQKAMTMPLTPAQLLAFNRSVSSMLDSVTLLEHVLKRKIETVDCGLCGEC